MSNLGHSDHEKNTHNLCCKFTPLQYIDVRHNFAGKFPAKNSLSIAHSIDDFLMPNFFSRFITNVENFSNGRFPQYGP